MKKKPWLAALFSALIPGLGQIYAGYGERGGVILAVTIVVGNLNAIWLSVYAQSVSPSTQFWAVGLPRILHDLFAFYGIVFLIWQIGDAFALVRQAPNTNLPGQIDLAD